MDEEKSQDKINVNAKKLDALRHQLVNLQTIFKGFEHQFKKLEEEVLSLIEDKEEIL